METSIPERFKGKERTLTANRADSGLHKSPSGAAAGNKTNTHSKLSGLPQKWSDEKRWQVLMENIKDFGIFMLDKSGNIATWNLGAERLLGHRSDDIIGRSYSAIFTPEDIRLDQPEFELREAREKGRCEDERWHIRRDGTRFWASGILSPLWAEDGSLRGYAKIVRDITDRKMAELNIADANRRKDEFLAVLAHELRSPLAAITSAAQLISMSTSDGTILEAGAIVERQVGDMTILVDDLLDISRIGRGKFEIHRKSCKLNDLIHHALQTARPLIEARKHHVDVSLASEPIWLDGDPLRLAQAISNILINAAKYTDPGGQIQISSSREGPRATIRIKDNGTGLLTEMLDRIFETFVQADRTLTNSNGGLGIGLALVKRIIEMHGGTVKALSEGIGKGSEFVIQMPTQSRPMISEHDSTVKVTHSAPAQRLKILLAEDNRDAAEMLAMVLEKTGHTVSVVTTGYDALHLAAQLKPDVMILDIGLPGLDGYRVAEMIRRQSEFDSTTLMALTGYAQPNDLERASKAGFDHHLVKPVDIEVLMRLLRDRPNSG